MTHLKPSQHFSKAPLGNQAYAVTLRGFGINFCARGDKRVTLRASGEGLTRASGRRDVDDPPGNRSGRPDLLAVPPPQDEPKR
jgi:hypothetical protein